MKLDKKTSAESELTQRLSYTLKADRVNLELIRQKDFLSVREVATLLSCNTKTVYRMIGTGKLNAHNFSSKKTIIRRSDIEKLFDTPKTETKDDNCVMSLAEIQARFKISYNGLSNIIKRNNIQTEKRGNRVFVKESDILSVFTN
ncbi:helix-turn-helix domain-containing protein [Taibaiella soli]|uniref:Helix-turn-helix domain-containing protein n=1 Tax=Taibaiella soli TaxID=1649169 RepID=A0A2W2BAX1_9BACT|nr:hypothetical protein DN068_21685 [Taibaiella soli]